MELTSEKKKKKPILSSIWSRKDSDETRFIIRKLHDYVSVTPNFFISTSNMSTHFL